MLESLWAMPQKDSKRHGRQRVKRRLMVNENRLESKVYACVCIGWTLLEADAWPELLAAPTLPPHHHHHHHPICQLSEHQHLRGCPA